MRTRCERCEAPLDDAGPAFICSFECTFCDRCMAELGGACPNCGGELNRRPRRGAPARKPVPVAAPGEGLGLEDLTPGRRLDGATVSLSAADIVEFARAFDPQSFHMDPDAAKRSIFGGHVASGWHTGALVMRGMVEGPLLAGTPLVGLKVDGLEFSVPVRPGDSLAVSGEVIDARASTSKPDRGIARIRITMTRPSGEVASSAVATLLVPRRGAIL